jgi:hypothetical protein
MTGPTNPLMDRKPVQGRVTRGDLENMADSLNGQPWAIAYGWRWHVENRNGRAILTRADNRMNPGGAP